MKEFTKIEFDPLLFLQELSEFKTLLNSSLYLSEQDDILPFFRKRLQLSLAISWYSPKIHQPNCIAFEYNLFGDFICDLVIGNSDNKAYCFVEFENAAENSIFRQNKRNIAEWSPRFEKGFNQILDWFYKLDIQRETRDFEYRFGHRSIDYMGLLIIGRNSYLSPKNKDRLNWRRQKTLVNSKHINCVTFDELYQMLSVRENWYLALISNK